MYVPQRDSGLALCPANGCVDGNKLIYSTCVRDGDTRLRIKCLNIKRKKEISDRQIFFYLLIEGVIFTAATYVNKDCVYILTRVLCNHTVLIKYERGRGGGGRRRGKKSRPRSSVSWDSFGPCGAPHGVPDCRRAKAVRRTPYALLGGEALSGESPCSPANSPSVMLHISLARAGAQRADAPKGFWDELWKSPEPV